MFERFREAGKDTLIFVLGSVLRRASQFLLLPIYVRYLTPADYGMLSLLLVASSLLFMVPSSVAGPSLFRSYYDYQTKEDHAMVVSTALFLCLGIAGLMLFLGILFARWLSALLTGDPQYGKATVLMLLYGVTQSINYVLLAVFRAQRWSVRYNVLSVISAAVSVVATFYLLVVQSMNVLGAVMGLLVGGLVSALLSIWMVRSYLQPRVSLVELKKMVQYGLPYIPANFANFAQNSADRVIIQSLLGPAAVGIYALARQLGQIVDLLFVQPFGMVFPAIVFSAEHDPRAKEFYARLLTYFLLIAVFLGLVVSLLAEDIICLMAEPSYWGAGPIVPWICLAAILYGARDPAGVGLGLKRRTRWFAVAVIVGLTVYLAAMFIFPSVWGLQGAGTALAISYAVVCGVYYWASQRIFPVRFEGKRLVKILIATALTLGAGRVITFHSLWFSVVIKTLVVAVAFPLFLVLLGFPDSSERSWGLKVLKVRLNKLTLGSR